MVVNKKMPVSVYQIDLSQFGNEDFSDITDRIIRSANLQDVKYTEENVVGLISSDFEIRIFSASKRFQPRWAKFLSSVLDNNSKLNYYINQTNAFICFIGFEQQIFAITGGFGCFAIEHFTSS